MKTARKMAAFLLALCAVLSFAACGGGQDKNNNGGGTGEKPVPSDGKVAFDTTLMNEYANENVYEITATEEGLKMEGIQNLKAACSKMRFSILDGEQFSCTFAVPVYEEESEEFLVTGVNMHTQRCVDIILRGQTQEIPIAQLRLWGDKSTSAAGVSAYITYGLNGRNANYDSSFKKEEATYPYAEINMEKAGYILAGNTRASMPFTIVFDKENLFQSYVVNAEGKSEELVPLLDENNAAHKKVIDGMKAAFENVGSVSAVFRFSGQTRADLEKIGWTGFEASSCLILKEVNGQSLCCGEERIKDTGKPYIAPPEIVEGKQLSAYSSYLYEVKTNEANEAGRETVLYSAFASDVISWKNLTYSLIITAPDGTVTTTEGLSFTLGAAGEYKFKAVVRDESGNEYVSPERTFTAADSYRINVEGDIPSTASKGDTFRIPAAYVTNAEGGRTDASGAEYSYTVEVLDPVGMKVTIGEDGTITFSRTGMYIITYSSSSADGEDEREYRITVS